MVCSFLSPLNSLSFLLLVGRILDEGQKKKAKLTREHGWNLKTESIVATNDHDLHKLRRSAVGPFFSTQNTRALQPVIEERVDALMARLREHGKTNKGIPLNMMYACSATSYGKCSVFRHHF